MRMQRGLQNVEALSDDEQCQGPPRGPSAVDHLSDDEEVNAPAPGPAQAAKKRKKRKKQGVLEDKQHTERFAEARQHLRSVAFTKCKCSDSDCRKAFRNPAAMDDLLHYTLHLRSLPKVESDIEATWFLLFGMFSSSKQLTIF